MKKFLPHILVSTFLLVAVLGNALSAHAQAASTIGNIVGASFDVVGFFIHPIVLLVLKLASFITILGGTILNASVYITVVNMAKNFSDVGAINEAWGVIRDVANMGFIFVLLWASIQMILGIGKDTRQLIVNMIIAAILINFSLFFTKVVIDAANLLAVTFYHAISPGAGADFLSAGLSNAIMKPLGIETIWKLSGDGTNFSNFAIVGLLASVVLLVVAFVFFAIALMLVIRFVVLIFVLILSPIAFVSNVLPGLSGPAKQWKEALFNQAFFAPVYFLLTWVTILVINGITEHTLSKDWSGAFSGVSQTANGVSTLTYSPGLVTVFINFVVIVAFLIISLVVSKNMANKTGGVVSKLTQTALGLAGSSTFGFAGRIARTTVGAGAEVFSKSSAYKRLESASPNSMAARLALAATDKTKRASFDIRGSRLGGTLAEAGLESGTAGGQGGFESELKGAKEFFEARGTESAKARAERARKAQGQLDIEDGIKPSATPTQIKAMEQSIAKMSDKEIEAIVDTNRKLLDNQHFANTLSVKQLEALNKSDKFSETEKDSLKSKRFSAINAAMASGTPATVKDQIKALSDSELEMIDPSYLGDKDFVAQLKGSQIEAVNKSSKFTKAQKDALKMVRRRPLDDAIVAGNAAVAGNELQKMNPKEITALGINKMIEPTLLQAYTPNMLKRMAQEMNTADIQNLRISLLAGGNPDTKTWLNDPKTGFIDFS